MQFLKKFTNKNTLIIALSVLLTVMLVLCGVLVYLKSNSEAEINRLNKDLKSYKSDYEKSVKDNSSLTEENNNLKNEIATLAEKKRLEAEAAQQAAAKAAAAPQGGGQPSPYLVPLPNWRGGQVCYLTFDDGPTNNTLRNLQTLAQYNVKATFFVVDNGNTSIMKNIVDSGHAIGLHAGIHEYYTIYKSLDTYLTDLQRVSDVVKNATGVTSKIVRFPGGSSNTVSRGICPGIMTAAAAELNRQGYQYFDWNISSGDADGNNVPVRKLLTNIFNGAVGKPNICILMHDTMAKGTTCDALPYIIAGLNEMGYRFDVLTPECNGFHQRIAN